MDDRTFTMPEEEIEKTRKDKKITPIKQINVDDYPLLNFDEIKNDAPILVHNVIEPILPVQGIGWIYAATGVGKTLFTLNVAYMIASGGRFLKYGCARPQRVAYIDAEMPYNQIHTRLMNIARAEGELDFPENLKIMTPDKIPYPIPHIDTEEGQFIYGELIKKYNIEVIIFDNLSMLSSIDDSKIAEWKPIQKWLLSLRRQGVTIIMVHHAGKAQDGYRGTSGMMDCAEFAISLQPVEDFYINENEPFAKKFKIVYSKSRAFGGQDAMPYEVTLMNGQWSYQSMQKSEMDRVVEMVGLKMTQIAIAKELNCGQSKIAKMIKKARKIGLLQE